MLKGVILMSSRAVWYGIAAVIIIAIVGYGIYMYYTAPTSSPSPSPTPTATPTPTPTPTTSPTPTPTATPTPTPTTTPSPTPTPTNTTAEITKGENYFEGTTSLTNGGPACKTCHSISVLNLQGGAIGPDLSGALNFTTQPAGYSGPYLDFEGNVTAITDFLHHPTLPVMAGTWSSTPLTDPEVNALTALIQYAYEQEKQ
jgi:hypothetical protein